MGEIHRLRGLIRRFNNLVFGYKTRTKRRRKNGKKKSQKR